MARVDVQDRVNKESLRNFVKSVRHEIEDASGRSIIEDSIFSSPQLIQSIFASLAAEQRQLATKVIAETLDIIKSMEFKRILSRLVERKIETMLGMACEELFRSTDEPFLLAIIPNLSSEYNLITSPKMVPSPGLEIFRSNAKLIF